MLLDEPLAPKSRWRTLWRDGQRYARSHRYRWQRWLKEGFQAAFVPQPANWPKSWFVWVPALLILGVSAYFALPFEPPVWAGAMAIALAGVLAMAFLRGPGLALPIRWLSVVFMVFALGFSAGQWRSASVQAPVLEAETRAVMVEGIVGAVEPRQRNRLRLTINQPVLSGTDEPVALERVRLTMPHPKADANPAPGDRISVRAILRPPPTPAYPDGYHFGRDLFFQQIGAVGYSIGPLTTMPMAEADTPRFDWRRWIEASRAAISDRITSALTGETGGVANALITGQRGGISDDTYDAIRQAGIAHLLAISGLHLGIVAGWIFVVVRLGLSLVPGLALGYPIKKYSAVFALVGAGLYVLLAGAPIPTIRAFIMVALGIGALWLDRDPFSLRLVGVAAIAVILNRPEAVIGPSFQMSFAAVTALIVTYQILRDRGWFAYRRDPGRWLLIERFGRFLCGLTLTTVIASLATAPFAIYHFQQVATFGLIGNLLGVPLATLWILPSGMIGLLLMPVGLESVPLAVMGAGIDIVLAMAADIAVMPWASVSTYAMNGLIILSLTFCALLVVARVLPMGLAGIAIAAMLIMLPIWRPTPILLVTADGDLMGLSEPRDHALYLNQTRRQQFTREQWQRRLAKADIRLFSEVRPPNMPIRCDQEGCLVLDHRGNGQMLIGFTPGVMHEACGSIPLILFPRHYERQIPHCNNSQILDRELLMTSLGLALYQQTDDSGNMAWRVAETREVIGDRPWSPAGR